ncbi:MAG: CHRD domain-containing protein, partial [Chitinophagaceae bacterium]|nr:CHRD domain-containing protein [Chitinophagaceae bacterium]
ICESAADFGVTKIFTPTTAILTAIKTDALYVNVHSTNRPSGIVRGQIR